MLLGDLERTLDGLIAGAGVCNDIPPPGEYTCQQQKDFGKCNENYIRDWGYCAETCMVCDSAFSLYGLGAPIQGLYLSRTSSVDCSLAPPLRRLNKPADTTNTVRHLY